MTALPATAPLPALRVKAHPGDLLPTVVIDSREQRPLPITRLPTATEGLQSGDYSVKGLRHAFAVERKSLDDLAACCAGQRERFERELARMQGMPFCRLLIVGTEQEIIGHGYRSNVHPRAILGSLATWEIRYRIPVVFSPTPDTAAWLVERWAWYAAREAVRAMDKLSA